MLMWKTYNYYSVRDLNEINSGESGELVLLQKLKQLNEAEASSQVKVTVYYEALCSDSRNFMLRELLPTYLALSKYLILDLVPYGKARTMENPDGKLEFHCQHGEIECLANKVHACTIDKVQDPGQLLQMVVCMIDNNIIPLDAAQRCASQHAVNYDAIAECTHSPRSGDLLRHHGIRTDRVHPSFIPTVELNDEMKVPLSTILKDLKKQVCANLAGAAAAPEECA